MGDKHSKHQGRGSPVEHEKPTTTVAASTTSSSPPPPGVAATASREELKPCEVLINSTSEQKDVAMAQMVRDALKNVEISVYIHSEVSEAAAKLAGQQIVDAKCLIYIASEAAATDNVGQDLISLAYISNKPILVLAHLPKKELLKKFVVGMKMTLNQFDWSEFDDKAKEDILLTNFVQIVQEQVSPKQTGTEATPNAADRSTLIGRRGGRLNTKLRTRSTVRDIGGDEVQMDNFWDKNFPEEDTVPWYKFQKCFLEDYESQLSTLFDESNIPWLLDMLKVDVFEGEPNVTKIQFFQVRGESTERNAFWKVVSQIAVEKFNMKEVFNMNSSVRLTAIEKLATFQNPAVIEALMHLLEDGDPNVRAVAAISLGRTGSKEEKVVDCLIVLLKDSDRIVRQSACLSLGTMKAVKAIPHIGNIWRNDFISVVRNAARTALENMNIPEAKKVLSVTKILEDEIAALEGETAAV